MALNWSLIRGRTRYPPFRFWPSGFSNAPRPPGPGQAIKPFVYLDYFDIDPAVGFHRHSELETATGVLQGPLSHQELNDGPAGASSQLYLGLASEEAAHVRAHVLFGESLRISRYLDGTMARDQIAGGHVGHQRRNRCRLLPSAGGRKPRDQEVNGASPDRRELFEVRCCLFLDLAARMLCASSFRMNSRTSGGCGGSQGRDFWVVRKLLSLLYL